MTRLERQAYMLDYNRHYYEAKGGRPTVNEIMKDILLVIPPTKINFQGTDIDDPIVCSHFGCRKHLSEMEKLYGTKCVSCQGIAKPDASKFVSHPIRKSA